LNYLKKTINFETEKKEMTKESKINNYNPSGVGVDNGNIFGLPFNFEESDIVIFPVPWEVTTSFGDGTSKGPQAILDASPQLDLYHFDFPNAWKQGIYMLANSKEITDKNKVFKNKAKEIILLQEKGKTIEELKTQIEEVTAASAELNKWVFEQASTLLNLGKKVILLGGDHSTPLGYINALSLKHESFGILQIDAHGDLRNAYEGFEFSHASIMTNALKNKSITSLTQVAIRDICEEEVSVINTDKRIYCFYDEVLKREQFDGKTWNQQLKEIIATLPQKVYITFDIDCLDPKLCPNTGTPVAGGLEFLQAIEIIRQVKLSGKEIIGMDLNEVGNNPWDANVGARVLYQMCCYI
jgi:agmatinase